MSKQLTPAMLRELRSIERGDVSDLLDYGTNALSFYARDRVIGALERRGLIAATPDWTLTDAGRAALAEAVAADLLSALKHLEHNARLSGAEMGLALDVASAAIAKAESK